MSNILLPEEPIKIALPDFTYKRCKLRKLDWQCNNSPIGMLWVTEYENSVPIGVINIVTHEMYQPEQINNILPNVENMEQLKTLHDYYYPETRKWVLFVEKVLAFFRRKK